MNYNRKNKAVLYHADISKRYISVCHLKIVFYFLHQLSKGQRVVTSLDGINDRSIQTIGNLRTTTKFTTTTSVDWERTGTRTSVSAGKRKLKMQSIGRSTTTTLNVNKHVEVVQL